MEGGRERKMERRKEGEKEGRKEGGKIEQEGRMSRINLISFPPSFFPSLFFFFFFFFFQGDIQKKSGEYTEKIGRLREHTKT